MVSLPSRIVLVFPLFLACRSVSAPAIAVAPPPRAVSAPPDAPAAPLVARAPEPTAEPTPEPTAAPEPDELTLLREALPTLSRDPAEALRLLRRSRSAGARAWAAYAAHRMGDAREAEALVSGLEAEGARSPLTPEEVRVAGHRALWIARERLEAQHADALVAALPCEVFAWDGEAARRAFGPAHGSTRDALVAPYKQRCAAEALRAHLDDAGRARASAADEAVARALFRAWPQPDGTLWTAVSIATREVLRDAFLGAAPDLAGTDAAMRDVVGALAQEDPASLARVGAYRRAVEPHVGALASALCALGRARGEALTAGQCTRRAYALTMATFTTWVGARVAR